MHRLHQISGILLLIVYTEAALYGQSSAPTLRDAREIQLLAQRKVERGLADLLNTITFDELGEFERTSIVEDSYTESPNQVFFDHKVIVEDDLDPRRTPGTLPLDLPVGKYLSNFDLFYPKSEEQTIRFSEFRVSNLKKSEYYYVKVYYTSQFGSRQKQLNQPFAPAERVAEVRAERKDKKWVVFITRLAFDDKKDPNSTLNDVELAPDNTTENLADQGDIRERERESERMALDEYNRWLDAGDKAFSEKDYETALEAFTKADELNVYDDLLPRRKIYKVKKAFELETQSQAELANTYLSKAALAQKNRNYGEAVGLLRKAFLIRPDSAEIGDLIRTLNAKSNFKTELDEKFNAGKYSDVIKSYTQMLKNDADNSDHYLGRGLAQARNGDPSRALKDIDKALELDFANLAAFKARAELFADKKDYPKAIADLTNYLNIDPNSDAILRRRAELKMLTHNLTGSKEDFEQAIKTNPENFQNFIARGKLYQIQGFISLAKQDFSTAIRLRPVSPEAYYYQGLSHYNEGNLETAGKDFRTAIELNLSEELRNEIIRLAKEFYDTGVGMSNSRRYDDALSSFRKATQVYHAFAEAHHQLGETQFALQNYPAATEAYTQAALLNENAFKSFYKRGEAHQSMRNYQEAAADFKKARLINPLFHVASYEEANVLFRLSRYPEAVERYEFLTSNEKKLGKHFDDALVSKIYSGLGDCYYETGEHQKSIEEYSKAIKRNKKNADAYFGRARVYENAGYVKKALEDYQEACRYDPDNAAIKISLAEAMAAAGQQKKATQLLNEVIALDPANTCCKDKALLVKSDLLFNVNDYKNASQSYRAVFEVNPGVLSTGQLTKAGISCLMIRQADAALQLLSNATSRKDATHEAFFALSCYYLQEFNRQEALAWMEKALKTGMIDKKFVKNNKLLALSSKDKSIFKVLFDKYL